MNECVRVCVCVCVCVRARVCASFKMWSVELGELNQYGGSEVKSLSCVRLFATPWTIAYQAPPSMGFFRQEYWSGLPFSSPEDLPNPGIEPGSPTLQADTLTSEPPGKPVNYYLSSVKSNQCLERCNK